ncbi:hypothetical protein [Rhabdothermincola salaria]|uniref:hypothetical protein n=1 Tax=Rhabdothermincola salaria TaxID=2903142 RepID=UPI001E51AB20|nr:hypothetical protein [Rhabdothermincola salaria]MCD9624490.1 hypothetical protein [Rhabdothermincola salaria]
MTDHEHHDDLDPFERRLAARLDRRAATIAADPEGLSAIRARVGQRRRRRHLVVGVASVLALVVVVAGVLDLTRSPDDTDVVDAGGSTMPFLGFANDTWQVTTYAPGTSYVAFDSMEGPSDEAVTLLVTRDGTGPGETSQTMPSGVPGVERIAERTIEHSEGPLQVGTVRWASGEEDRPPTEGPALWWSPAPGWTATLMGNSPDAFADAEALLEAADPVVDVDRPTWERRLRSSVGDVLLSANPALVLRGADGSTQVVQATLDFVLMWIAPSGSTPPTLLVAGGPGVEFGLDGTEQPIEVRGRPGHLDEGRDAPERTISWTEGDRTYALHLGVDQSVDDALALADRLTMSTGEEWEDLLFPAEPRPVPPALLERWSEPVGSSASGTGSSPESSGSP